VVVDGPRRTDLLSDKAFVSNGDYRIDAEISLLFGPKLVRMCIVKN
jgi:hypothetical protein